jgi:FAD:protein FMN transferase
MSSITRCRPLLETYVKITITDDKISEKGLESLTNIAFERIARIQSLMSFHDSSSELARLNSCGHLYPLSVNPWTYEVIKEAQRISHASKGIFDITIAPTLARWGFLPSRHQRDQQSSANYKNIHLHNFCRVVFDQPLQIDLGGIAKGFAVDKAVEILLEAGITDGCINAGGDIRFLGTQNEMISVRDPAAEHQQTIDIPTKANALTKVVLLGTENQWQDLLAKEQASVTIITEKGRIIHFPTTP